MLEFDLKIHGYTFDINLDFEFTKLLQKKVIENLPYQAADQKLLECKKHPLLIIMINIFFHDDRVIFHVPSTEALP